MSKTEMIVAGLMSGTSADGIDVALLKIVESKPRGRVARGHTLLLLGHAAYPYSPKVRQAILSAMNATSAPPRASNAPKYPPSPPDPITATRIAAIKPRGLQRRPRHSSQR